MAARGFPREPVELRSLRKDSLRDSLVKCGCSEQDPLPFLPSSFLASSRALSSGPLLQFWKFSEACAGRPAFCVFPSEQVPVRILGFPSLDGVAGYWRVALGWPRQSWTRRRPRGTGSQGLPCEDSSRVAATRWPSI